MKTIILTVLLLGVIFIASSVEGSPFKKFIKWDFSSEESNEKIIIINEGVLYRSKREASPQLFWNSVGGTNPQYGGGNYGGGSGYDSGIGGLGGHGYNSYGGGKVRRRKRE